MVRSPIFKITGIMLALILVLTGIGYSARIAVFTAANIVSLINGKIVKTKTFSGSFVYTFNNKTYWGSIVYKAPNKFVMSFMDNNGSGQSYDTGQRFISDGKILCLYFKTQNIAINETLEKASIPLVGWNINRLLKEFVPSLPKNNGYKVEYENQEAYKLIFIPKSPTAGFKYINMIISLDGDILKLEAQNQLGRDIELGIRYDAFNNPVSEDMFDYSRLFDDQTEVFQNILLPRGENSVADQDQ